MKKKNFDTYLEERKKKSPSFEMFGKEYVMAPTIPFAAVLSFRALSEKNKNEELQNMEILDLFKDIFGQDTLDSLSAHKEFDIDMAMELMKWAFEIYGVSTKENEVKDSNPKQ